MRTLRLRFNGSFEDAYVYMERLALLHADRSLQFIDLNALVRNINESNAAFAPLATYAFARNDWLSSEALATALRNEQTKAGFDRALDHFPKEYEVSLRPDKANNIVALPLKSAMILDVLFYNRRLYIAANDGLWHIDAELDRMELCSADVERRHEAKCFRVGARYGMVSASCGAEGLWSYFNEFEVGRSGYAAQHKTADRSLRTSWVSSNMLANYPSNSRVALYETEKEKVDAAIENERQVATGMHGAGEALDFKMVSLLSKHDVEGQDIQFTFDNKRYLFVRTYAGEVFCLHQKKKPGGEVSISLERSSKSQGGKILSVAVLRTRIVIETESHVFLYSGGASKEDRWTTLFDGPVFAVRTFQSSRRYQNLVAITHDAGVDIISVID